MNPIVKRTIEKINRKPADSFDGLPPLSVSMGAPSKARLGDAIELSRLADIAMTALKQEEKQGHRSSGAALSGERRI